MRVRRRPSRTVRRAPSREARAPPRGAATRSGCPGRLVASTRHDRRERDSEHRRDGARPEALSRTRRVARSPRTTAPIAAMPRGDDRQRPRDGAACAPVTTAPAPPEATRRSTVPAPGRSDRRACRRARPAGRPCPAGRSRSRSSSGSKPAAVVGDLERDVAVALGEVHPARAEASAYFATFCSASRQQKYSVGLDLAADTGRAPRRRPSPAPRPSAPGRRARRPVPCRPAAADRSRARGRAGPRARSSPIPGGRRASLPRRAGVPVDQRACELELHGQRDELLLRAVVEVALDLAALLVLRGHEALARAPQVLDQCGVPQHEAGLRGEVGDQPLLGRARSARRAASSIDSAPSSSPWWRTGTEAVGAGVGPRQRRARGASVGQPGDRAELVARLQPHVGARSAAVPSPRIRAIRGSRSSSP